MKIMEILDAEIEASNKQVKPVHAQLTKTADGIYKGYLPFKIEGDYVLNSNNMAGKLVTVDWQDNQLTVEFDSEEEEISAFLSKDESQILRALKDNLKQETLSVEPAFIVGPPGTGKTKVITKILEEAIANNMKVLVLSPTNMAVENVFERINIKTMGLGDGEVILTIKTENEHLDEFSPKTIMKRKLQIVEDEIEIFSQIKTEMEKAKRDAQPRLNSLKCEKEAASTLFSNHQRELNAVNSEIKKAISELDSIDSRIKSLTGNALLKSIASIFTSKKVEDLEIEKIKALKNIEFLNKQKMLIEESIKEVSASEQALYTQLKEANAQIFEATSSLSKVNKRISELEKTSREIKASNIFSSAKIVGATLVNAALNARIQNDRYDIIIVDEASMALYPLLVAASQALKENNETAKEISYNFDENLYEAQNKAVLMALNSKIVFVGDPKQLQPIARTYEMKKSIFSIYSVDAIFKGEEIEDTVFLDINFRNHPHITKLASDLFYGGMLKSGKEDDGKDSLFIKRSTSKMVTSLGSYVNHGNAKIVVEQVSKALGRGRRSIGIITPYRKQAELISNLLAELKEQYQDADIQAGTVHTFQGKEKEIIIYDLTYSPSEMNGYSVPAAYNGGTDSDTANLLNVAMTRAESFFIVVGDTEGIANMPQDILILKDWIKGIGAIN